MASGFESQSRPRTRTIGRDSKRSVAVADHQPRTRTTALGFGREIQNRADGIGLRKSISASDTGVHKRSAPKRKGINRRNPRRLLSSLDLQIGLGQRRSVAGEVAIAKSVAVSNLGTQPRSRSRTISLGHGRPLSASSAKSKTNRELGDRSRAQTRAPKSALSRTRTISLGFERGHPSWSRLSVVGREIKKSVADSNLGAQPRSRTIGLSRGPSVSASEHRRTSPEIRAQHSKGAARSSLASRES